MISLFLRGPADPHNSAGEAAYEQKKRISAARSDKSGPPAARVVPLSQARPRPRIHSAKRYLNVPASGSVAGPQ